MLKHFLSALFPITACATVSFALQVNAQTGISEIRGGQATPNKSYASVGSYGLVFEGSESGEGINAQGTPYAFDSMDLCNVTLIAPDLVITGARCVVEKKGNRYKKSERTAHAVFIKGNQSPELFFLDNPMFNPQELKDKGVIIRKLLPENIVFHPSVLKDLNTFDRIKHVGLAVIKLDKPIYAIKPAKLADKERVNAIKPGDILVTAGFGELNTNGDTPAQIHKARLPVKPFGQCNRDVIKAGEGPIHPSQICLNAENKSTCPGDVGAPLFVSNKNGEKLLVGIYNFVWKNGDNPVSCQDEAWSSYTKLSEVSAWIDSFRKSK